VRHLRGGHPRRSGHHRWHFDRAEADRIVVTLEYLDEVTRDAGRSHPELLMYVPGDRVRSIVMPVDWWMASRGRWWSWS
jgi:hypothetical protein